MMSKERIHEWERERERDGWDGAKEVGILDFSLGLAVWEWFAKERGAVKYYSEKRGVLKNFRMF